MIVPKLCTTAQLARRKAGMWKNFTKVKACFSYAENARKLIPQLPSARYVGHLKNSVPKFAYWTLPVSTLIVGASSMVLFFLVLFLIIVDVFWTE